MNQADKKEFELIHDKIDTITADIKLSKKTSSIHMRVFGLRQNLIHNSDRIQLNGEVSSAQASLGYLSNTYGICSELIKIKILRVIYQKILSR